MKPLQFLIFSLFFIFSTKLVAAPENRVNLIELLERFYIEENGHHSLHADNISAIQEFINDHSQHHLGSAEAIQSLIWEIEAGLIDQNGEAKHFLQKTLTRLRPSWLSLGFYLPKDQFLHSSINSLFASSQLFEIKARGFCSIEHIINQVFKLSFSVKTNSYFDYIVDFSGEKSQLQDNINTWLKKCPIYDSSLTGALVYQEIELSNFRGTLRLKNLFTNSDDPLHQMNIERAKVMAIEKIATKDLVDLFFNYLDI